MPAQASVSWFRSFMQPVTFLGLAMIVFVISGLTYLLHKDREDAFNAAQRNGANLAQMFEGYMSRSLKSVDTTLRMLRSAYLHDPKFDIAAWARNSDVRNDLTLQLSIIGRDGIIKMVTSGSAPTGINISDREHFQVHVNSSADNVFISKPVHLRTRDEGAIVMSRRITAADGSFAGIISAAIDPSQLQSFYEQLDLGTGGIASLVGFDGVIRARGGSDSSAAATIGRKAQNAEVMARYKDAPSGVYWNSPESSVDGTRRLINYRVVDGFPLIAIIGLARSDIYRHSAQNARIYYALSGVIILVIAAYIGFGAARERKLLAMSASLARTNARFESALANLPLGLCMFGPDKRIVVSNDRYRQMYGLSAAQMRVGTSLEEILRARVEARSTPKGIDGESYIAMRLSRAFKPEPGHLIEELQDGRVLAVSRQSVPGGGWITVHQDVTAAKRAEAEITQLALFDGLTGLANRNLFLQRVNAATDACRQNGTRLAVHLLDLDRFKEVNDTLGHAFGDQLLIAAAERIVAALSDRDVVGRLGGDEFAVLQPLPDGDESSIRETAELLLQAVREPFTVGDHTVTVETSIGIALAPDHGQQAEQLLKTADLALYKAKSEGRNTYRVFVPEMEMQARAKHALETDLRNAIASNAFEIHYQPIIATANKEICGVEALVRWQHPRQGLVSPDNFIPLAEETGLIVPLGEWVLRTACRDAASWPEHIKVAVNLSSVQFRQGNLLQIVIDALEESGLPPQRLELEVTESVLLQNNADNLALLHQFRAFGISIALDDFGTGYSSLSYLQRFPFDKIKIDRSFVGNLSERADCVAIVSAVTGLARALDIKTTAEGVETLEQFALLQAAGCSQAQGYLFGKPRHKDDLGFQWVADLAVA